MAYRGRLVTVGAGGWVWCTYLLSADENTSLPAGCCSFSGQVWLKGLGGTLFSGDVVVY